MNIFQIIEAIGTRPPIDPRFNRRDWLRTSIATTLAVLGLTGLAQSAQSGAREQPAVPETIPWDLEKHLLPHFLAHDATNQDQLVPLGETAVPQAVTLRKGKAVIEFRDTATEKLMHLDPVALNYKDWGAHPAEKLLWAKDTFGLDIQANLQAMLEDADLRDQLFHRVSFEHRFGTVSTEVVSVVAADGTYVTSIKPGTRPPEWEAAAEQTLYPDWFGVYPGHIIEEQSQGFIRDAREIQELNKAQNVFREYGDLIQYEVGLAKDPMEGPILGLVVDGVDPESGKTRYKRDQATADKLNEARDVLLGHTLKQISWGIAQTTYNGVLAETGYQFNPSIFGPTLQDKVRGIFMTERGYSVYSSLWTANRVREAGIDIGPNCTAYNFSQVGENIYFVVRDFDTGLRSFHRLGSSETQSEILFTMDRGLFFSMINPHNPDEVLLSIDYRQDHPLFQCLYVMKLFDQSNTKIVRFPGKSRFGRDELLVFDGRYDEKGNIICNRYGFPDEGGGYKYINLRYYPDTYHEENSPAKVTLHRWDHALDWRSIDQEAQQRYPFPTPTASPTPLPTPTPNPTQTHRILLPMVAIGKDPRDLVVAAKEAEAEPPLPNFAMTVSRLILDTREITPTMSPREVLGVMAGWNNFIRHVDVNSIGGKADAYTESIFDYLSAAEDRPTGICRVKIR